MGIIEEATTRLGPMRQFLQWHRDGELVGEVEMTDNPIGGFAPPVTTKEVTIPAGCSLMIHQTRDGEYGY